MKLVPADFSEEELPAFAAALTAAREFQKARAADAQREADAALDRSYGNAFLCEFRARRGEFLQPLQLQLPDGKLFQAGAQALSFVEFLEIGVCMARDGYGLHDLTSPGAQAAFYSALFFVGTMRFDEENERLFGHPDEAKAWMHEPGFIEVPLHLRSYLLEMNPTLKKVCGPDGLEILLSGPVE